MQPVLLVHFNISIFAQVYQSIEIKPRPETSSLAGLVGFVGTAGKVRCWLDGQGILKIRASIVQPATVVANPGWHSNTFPFDSAHEHMFADIVRLQDSKSFTGSLCSDFMSHAQSHLKLRTAIPSCTRSDDAHARRVFVSLQNI